LLAKGDLRVYQDLEEGIKAYESANNRKKK